MSTTQFTRLLALCFVVGGSFSILSAGVSKEVEAYYREEYENKALFLKVPVNGSSQVLYVRAGGTVAESADPAMQVSFKVAEQIRITRVDFKETAVEFALVSLDGGRSATVVFQFANALNYSFSERPSFDSALRTTFTEGLTYQEIEQAKKEYIQDQTERLVRRFASTTNTTADFVRSAMRSSDPTFEQSLDRMGETERRLKELEEKLASETARVRRAENELASTKADLLDANRSTTEIRQERDDLAQKNAALTQEISSLERASRETQDQLRSVAGKLDLQTGSNVELGKQLEALSKEIDTLKTDRNRLSVRVNQQGEELEGLTKERDKLSGDLKSAERRADRLQSNLNALTSNRNSLEANFLKTKEEKDNLELARELERSITVRRRLTSENGESVRINELYLLSQKIGQVEVTLPVAPQEACRIAYRAESPELVQFSEEERRLYEVLGSEAQVENEWKTGLSGLQATLLQGEAVQRIPSREAGEWVWGFDGQLEGPSHIAANTYLVTVGGQRVLALSQDFELDTGSLLGGFAGSFSLFSLLLGLFLGLGCYAVISVLRRRGRSNGRPRDRQVRYSAQKEM